MSNARANVNKLRSMSATSGSEVLTMTARVAVPGDYSAPLYIGSRYLWVDTTGDLRLSTSTSLPSTDTSGVIAGTQS